MTRITWEKSPILLGVDRGVFYPGANPGVPWSGLTKVTQNSDVTQRYIFIDGKKQESRILGGVFSGSISAYTYPREFEEYEVSHALVQSRSKKEPFHFSYREKKVSSEHYLIHLVYNAIATPQSIDYSMVSATDFTWDISTIPLSIENYRPTSHILLDTEYAYDTSVYLLEEKLYGNDLFDPQMPTLDELLAIFESTAILKITDNGDGTFTAEGPDEVVYSTGIDSAEISWSSVEQLSSDTYRLSSY